MSSLREQWGWDILELRERLGITRLQLACGILCRTAAWKRAKLHRGDGDGNGVDLRTIIQLSHLQWSSQNYWVITVTKYARANPKQPSPISLLFPVSILKPLSQHRAFAQSDCPPSSASLRQTMPRPWQTEYSALVSCQGQQWVHDRGGTTETYHCINPRCLRCKSLLRSR